MYALRLFLMGSELQKHLSRHFLTLPVLTEASLHLELMAWSA